MRRTSAIGLLALSVALLSLAFAPWGQFYLAWIALVPWLIVVRATPHAGRALLLGWLAGAVFFALNMSWLGSATIPGAVAACIVLGLSWGLVAAAIRATVNERPNPLLAIFFIAACWCAGEWLRALAVGGFPWLLLGHSQSKFLLMCQIADTTGVYGVSFWVAAVNALIAMSVRRGADDARIALRFSRSATATVAAMLILVATYGVWRMGQSNVLSPGPAVMVVQSNIVYARGGIPSAHREQIAEMYFLLTQKALAASSPPPDLIVWAEAMMPPLNAEARQELRHAAVGPFLQGTHERLAAMAALTRGGLVTGGYYVGGWKSVGRARVADDRRNSAFFYTADGTLSSSRYDKIKLVPFAESMPWPSAPSWMRSAMFFLAAPSAREPDTAGDANRLTVFEVSPGGPRFVTPICFENVDAPFIARMLRGTDGSHKRADFIANLTNDGWFSDQEHAQHFQAIVFGAIENRVPIARASNTGISGFVDSNGRVLASLPPHTEGASTQTLAVDSRRALYTRFGDVFAGFCTIAVIVILATTLLGRR